MSRLLRRADPQCALPVGIPTAFSAELGDEELRRQDYRCCEAGLDAAGLVETAVVGKRSRRLVEMRGPLGLFVGSVRRCEDSAKPVGLRDRLIDEMDLLVTRLNNRSELYDYR